MSTGRKACGSATSAGASRDAAKKWVAEETRAEANEVFAQHTRETSNLDVLSRCKKLNELLNSDILKGKGDAKAHLKEILGILHTGPKRPAFLDKPPVTTATGKRGTSSSCEPERPRTPPTDFASSDGDAVAIESTPLGGRVPERPVSAMLQRPSEEVEDIITLLNGTLPVSDAQVGLICRTTQKAQLVVQSTDRTAQQQAILDEAAQAQRLQERRALAEAEERERNAKEAMEEAERERKIQEALEATAQERKAEEEKREQRERQRASAAEALRMQRVQYGAALCIQSHWRGHCGRRQAALRRQELKEQHAAASILQAAWRSRQATLQYRQRLVAAGTLQCAIRAWRARRHLHERRVEAFTRRRAARCIQRVFLVYRARGYALGPLRLPPGTRPETSLGVDGAALLAKQLRLRSAVDTRLAPECASSSSGGGDDDSARQHRTVVTHMERVRQVSANERHRRCDVSQRAIMVASEHRDTAEALAIARQGFGTSTPRAVSPSKVWSTADAVRPQSRRASGSRSGSEAGAQILTGALSIDSMALAFGARPSTGLRRAQGSWGG